MSSPALRTLVLALAVVAADQLTKAWARASIDRGDRESFLPLVDLVNTRNRGIAFGLLAEGGLVVAAVSVAAVAALAAFFLFNRGRPLVWLPTGLLLGGAAGNLIDRVREDAVTDFIDLPAWPAFNLADVAITLGVLSMLWVMEGPRTKETDRG